MKRRRILIPILAWFLSNCFLSIGAKAFGASPKTPEKPRPQVLVAIPLGVTPGITNRVILRGLALDAATSVRSAGMPVNAKIVSKGKASVPAKQEAARVGDTEIVVDITVPPGASAGISVIVTTPNGETKPHSLIVENKEAVLQEKEPNNAFDQAQPIQLNQYVDGSIGSPLDVDVFRFEGQSGQRIVLEVLAARYGSALDSILTLYDAGGHEIATCDDSSGSPDSRIDIALPKTGVYYLSLIDANDQGGPAHVYRLHAMVAK